MPEDVHGILLLDKPLGLSSAAAVARAKWLFQARKAGHTGSLDPLASGLLPVCFGEATKFGAQMLDADKTYRVTVRLGERTPSADRESAVVERRELPAWPAARLEQALAEFPREYAQVPPMHSAIKQDGRPLYEYARAGEWRERAPRAVVIREMRLIDWRSPDLSFDVRCTKGAYIRVLAEDLAARLETIGHLTALRRLGVAPFAAERQWTFESLEAMTPCGAPRGAASRGCRARRTGGGWIFPRMGWRRFGRVSRSRFPCRMPRKRAHLCGGRRFPRSGGGRSRRAIGAAATYLGGDESSLRRAPATRTMRAS